MSNNNKPKFDPKDYSTYSKKRNYNNNNDSDGNRNILALLMARHDANRAYGKELMIREKLGIDDPDDELTEAEKWNIRLDHKFESLVNYYPKGIGKILADKILKGEYSKDGKKEFTFDDLIDIALHHIMDKTQLIYQFKSNYIIETLTYNVANYMIKRAGHLEIKDYVKTAIDERKDKIKQQISLDNKEYW